MAQSRQPRQPRNQPRNQPRISSAPVTDAAPDDRPVETDAAADAPEQPAPAAVAPITGERLPEPPSETLAAIDGDITQMTSLRATLAAQQEETERAHAQYAATSPLALRLEVVGCEYAAEVWPDGPNAGHIPQYQWGEMRCPFGKERPDQDCRDCVHHRVKPLDINEPPHTRRYSHYGPIIPLTDDEATALSHYVRALNKPPLRRVVSELHAVDLALERARVARAAEARRELERQQGGR